MVSIETFGFLYRDEYSREGVEKLVAHRPKCQKIDWDERLHFRHYVGSYVLLLFLGAYTGLSHYGTGYIANDSFKDKQIGIAGFFLRLVVLVLILAPMYLCKKLEFDFMGTSGWRIVLDCLLRMAIPCYICGYLVFSLAPYLYERFDCIDQRDNRNFEH